MDNIQQTQAQKKYQQRVNERMPKSKIASQCLRAFIAGGLICCIGQAVRAFGAQTLQLDEKNVAAFTSIVMVFLGATLTGLGVYDKIGSWSGAGSIVPITGFANSIVSPAMEFKREGYVMGVGAKLFSIAGPVLVYGISASVLVGLIACMVR
ncbi:MAG: stage V sporulation protein AC [Christensenellaceae bacterium]|jgi:stage V sporulation protein AC|nr:stage V sporulation protein AC [Christensenellaceae bacterium]